MSVETGQPVSANADDGVFNADVFDTPDFSFFDPARPAIVCSENPGASLPHVEDRDWLMVAGLLVPALFKVVPSYLFSFLVHVVVVVAMAMVLQSGGPEKALVLNAGITVSPDVRDDDQSSTSFESKGMQSELAELQSERASSAIPIGSISLNSVNASAELLAGDADLDNFGYESISTVGLDGVGSDDGGKAGDNGEYARFFGVKAKGRRLVFIIDCSGSMEGLRWNLARAELKKTIMDLSDDKEFLVLLYNHGTWAMFNQALNEADLVPANSTNKRRFLLWLAKQKPRGWTRPMTALQIALSRQPDAVYLLSDGELQDNSQSYLLESNGERAFEDGSMGKTPVHTVALDLSVGSELLEAIANENAGVFTHIVSQKAARR